MINTLFAQSKLKQLLALLGQERVLLINGPLDNLEDLAKKRDSLLNSMVNGGPVTQQVLADGLPKLRLMARRNAQLLKASMDGMKAAQASVDAIESNACGLETYTSDGQLVRSVNDTGKPATRV